jgi:alanyl-tRNA synthetase
MIADGVLPSNEGRGYVLRRLLRRAARHGKLLGVNKPFLFEVVGTVIKENETHYSYLRERAEYITRIVKIEEENFARTIDTGMRIFGEKLQLHKENGETVYSIYEVNGNIWVATFPDKNSAEIFAKTYPKIKERYLA